MIRKLLYAVSGWIFISIWFPLSAFALLGDADGNGVLDLDDARIIARFVVKQIPAIPNPGDADATQDGQIDMADAFAIAQKVSGQSRIIVVAPYYGYAGELLVGDTIRIEVFERFFPLSITGGTVRIQSASTAYDSGDQPLTFERDGRSLYYHWETAGLTAAADYEVVVTLTGSGGAPLAMNYGPQGNADAVVALTNRVFEQPFLAWSTDAYCPAPGLPLEFRRAMPNDHAHYPYLGPFGTGWAHNYDMHLTEFTDGRIAYHGPNGFNRFFKSNADGTYTASPGDYGKLTRDPDGTFQLREKDGLIYRFRSDLRFDYMQDLNGNRITAIYDGSNRLAEIRHTCGKSFFLGYNGENRISSLTDHVGRVTSYEYTNPIGAIDILIIQKTLLWKATDPAGKVTEYKYNPLGSSYILNSRLLSVINPDGTQTNYEYDSKVRLSRQTAAGGANPLTYAYDSDGTTHIVDSAGADTIIKVNDRAQIVSATRPEAGSPPAPWQMLYDTSANLSRVTDPLGYYSQMSYDAVGNMTQFINPLLKSYRFGYDLRFNKVSQITNPLGKATSFAYSDAGNLTRITYPDPAGSRLAFTYDAQGNLLAFQDPALKTTEFTNNSQGQVTNIKDALNNSTQLAYYPNGRLQTVTDAELHTITYTRDTLGRLTRRTYPDGSYEEYSYDDFGKVTSMTNRSGEQITFSYDATGRPQWKNYASGKKLHAYYDSRGLLSQIEKEEGGATTLDTAYEYDLSSRITVARVPRPITGTYDVSYSHDAADNVKSVTYPDGYVLNYEYDVAGQLKRISDSGGSTIVAYDYDDAGRRIRKTLGNGTYTTYSYDDLNRLTQLVNHAPGGSVQSQFGYTYNAGGVIDTMTTLEGTHTYIYDNTYQLTGVTYPGGRTVNYTFDKVGNRKTVTENGVVTSYITNQLNQYMQVGSETFTYDNNGNIKTKTLGSDVTIYTWDEDDRLVAIDRGGIHIDYRYDHLGKLVGKNTGSGWRTFLWDGLDLIAEYDPAGVITKRYIYGNDIDEVLVVTDSAAKTWVHQDALGSAIGATNDDGESVSAGSYDVYGNIRNGNLGPVTQRLAGMIWDEDAGLYYVRARWYNSISGRFISADPLSIPNGRNLYTYVLNNPVNFTDPEGLQSVIESTLPIVVIVAASYAVIHQWIQSGGPDALHSLFRYIFDYLTANPKNWDERERGKVTKPKGGDTSKTWPIQQPNIEPPGPDDPESEDPKDWIKGPVWKRIARWFIRIIASLWETGGGACPTFIQLPLNTKPSIPQPGEHDISQEELVGEIMVPIDDVLLRSDIPIFGVAGGKNFKSYRVEYGKGMAPKEWHLIEDSTEPEPTNKVGLAEMRLMQGDLDIRGNLATWNTGLKNWVHLPWHPPEDPTDLNGVYTIRLVVEGKDGEKVEDRVIGEVGRVIAQCLPGIAESADKRVVMRFPEQSLTHPFRVYTIIPVADLLEDPPAAAPNSELIGPVYRIREAGDRFAKDVAIEFSASRQEMKERGLGHAAIAAYDSQRERWQFLPTTHRPTEGGVVFGTTLTELPESKAIYALMLDRERADRSRPQEKSKTAADVKLASSAASPKGFFVHDTFEKDNGGWKPRDRFVGAVLSRDKSVTPDGSFTLKLTNESFGGNFSATVLDQPFDAKSYPLMSFDYRIGPGVKIDFYLRVNGRWYNLGFTDDPIDFRYRDVNISNLGRIEGIKADDKWHSASVDLHKLLRGKTRHTVVEEIMMADWDVGGYMKLEFGQNPRGATFYVDNFKISSAGRTDKPAAALLIDDFSESKGRNLLGEEFGIYNPPGIQCVTTIFIDEPALKTNPPKSDKNTNRVMLLNYDTTQPDTYGGYWTSIRTADLSNYSTLAIRIHAESTMPSMAVGIKGSDDTRGETFISKYVSGSNDGFWRDVRIPLANLRNGANLSSPSILYFSAAFENGNDKGTLWVDDLRFEGLEPDVQPVALIADFESPVNWKVQQSGAATMSGAVMPDVAAAQGKKNKVCRISYGGSIGRDYGLNGGFSSANWTTALGGVDARPYKFLTLRIRGEKGGETPDFYLSDPGKRVCIRAKDLKPITAKWQDVELPLSYFADNGIDISRLDLLDISFQWKEQAGTIYVDDIRFSKGAGN